MREKTPYYKSAYGYVQVFAGRAGFPKITFFESRHSGTVYIRVGNILLGTKERRQFFFDNEHYVLQWIDIAGVLEDLPNHEARIAMLESGKLLFLGQPVCIKEKKK